MGDQVLVARAVVRARVSRRGGLLGSAGYTAVRRQGRTCCVRFEQHWPYER